MTSPETILVTGATGNVGLETAVRLLQEGRRVRALMRSPERGRDAILSAFAASRSATGTSAAGTSPTDTKDAAERLECVKFDFLSETPQPGLFAGVNRIFLMRPPDIGDVRSYMFPFLHAAREAGTKHIVLLSLLGAEKIFFIPHRKLEKEILRLGFRYHFLRAGFFMQNLDSVFDRFIREADELPVPAGRGRTSFVDARDLGEAGARLLCEAGGRYSGHGVSGAPELTGSEALDYYEVARMLGEELGRTIVYTNPGLKAFKRRVLVAGWDPGYAKIVSRLFYTVRFGMAAKITGELEQILGRPPRSLRQYIADYRRAWISSEAHG